MNIQITASYQKGNAPPGYLLARIEVAPGLYAESERNPYTNGEWRSISFQLGDADAPGCESQRLCIVRASMEGWGADIAREVFEILQQVSLWFDSTTLVVDLRAACA